MPFKGASNTENEPTSLQYATLPSHSVAATPFSLMRARSNTQSDTLYVKQSLVMHYFINTFIHILITWFKYSYIYGPINAFIQYFLWSKIYNSKGQSKNTGTETINVGKERRYYIVMYLQHFLPAFPSIFNKSEYICIS